MARAGGTRRQGETRTPPGTPARRVLVLMPFDPSFEDAYKLGIRDACQSAGWDCSRVDEQVFSGLIIEKIYAEIISADLIIADMTGRNPNVFYEVGYAHALSKQVVLLTRTMDDIPFDLRGHRHIVYTNSIVTLRELLYRELGSIPTENQLKATSPDIFSRLSETRLIKLVMRAGSGYPREHYEESVAYQDIFLMIANLATTNHRRRSIKSRLPTYIIVSKGESPIRYRTITENPDWRFVDENDYDNILAALNAWGLITFDTKIVTTSDGPANASVVKLTDFGQKQFGLLMPAPS